MPYVGFVESAARDTCGFTSRPNVDAFVTATMVGGRLPLSGQ
jgi:hypothetical protein